MKYDIKKKASRFFHEIISLIGYSAFKKKCLPFFLDHACDIKKIAGNPSAIKTIFDVGANIGSTSIYYAKEFESALIFSFEPSQDTFKKLKENTSSNPNIRPVCSALGEKVEKSKIYHGFCDLVHSMKKTEFQAGSCEEIQVTTIDVEIGKIGRNPEVLKIDTEGYEMEVLKGGSEWLSSPGEKFIYLETTFRHPDRIHKNLRHQTQFIDIYNYVINLGFDFVGVYDASFNTFDDPNERQVDFCNSLFHKKSS